MSEREAVYAAGDWWRVEDESAERSVETWLDMSKVTGIRCYQDGNEVWHCDLWAGQTYSLHDAEAERLRGYLLARQVQMVEQARPSTNTSPSAFQNDMSALEDAVGRFTDTTVQSVCYSLAEIGALHQRIAALECWRLCQTGD